MRGFFQLRGRPPVVWLLPRIALVLGGLLGPALIDAVCRSKAGEEGLVGRTLALIVGPSYAGKSNSSNFGSSNINRNAKPATSSSSASAKANTPAAPTQPAKTQTNTQDQSSKDQSSKDQSSKDQSSKQAAKPDQTGKKDSKADDEEDDDKDKPPRSSSDPDSPRPSRSATPQGGAGAEPPQTLKEWLQRYMPHQPPAPVAAPKPSSPAPAAAAAAKPNAGPNAAPVATPSGPVRASKADAAHSPGVSGPPTKSGAAAAQTKAPSAAKVVVAPAPPQTVRQKQMAAVQDRLRQEWIRTIATSQLLRQPPTPGTIRPKELLGLNLSAATQAWLRGQGVEIRPPVMVSQVTVTPLVLPADISPFTLRERLQLAQPNEAATYNYIYRPFRVEGESAPAAGQAARSSPGGAGECSNDGCYGRALIAWKPEHAQCAKDVTVGVVDTGYEPDHPAFANTKFNQGIFRATGRAEPPRWHGTGVLSLLSGDPRSSTPGLIPNATFLVADAFFDDGNGQPITDTLSLLNSMEWMDAQEVKVVNLSLAGQADPALHGKIQLMSAKGVVFVAAAGNGGPNAAPSYPAAYSEVIAVTAVDRDANGYAHANRGQYIDVAAPGVGIWTALPNKRAGTQTGTSFAVPYVTALAAAVYDDAVMPADADPLKTKEAILNQFVTQDLGPAGRDPVYGRGLVKAPTRCGGSGKGWAASTVLEKGQGMAAASAANGWAPSISFSVSAGGTISPAAMRSER